MPDSSPKKSAGAGSSLGGLAIHCVVFVLPLVLLAVYVERGLRTVPSPFEIKKSALEKEASNIELLAVGGSSVLHGIRPDQLRERAFNAAYNWQSIWYDEQYVSKYLSSLPRLKVVLVGLHYLDLEYRMPDSEEASSNQFLYSRFLGFSPEGHIDALEIRKVSLFAVYGPKSSLDLVSKGFRAEAAQGMDRFGWLPMARSTLPHDDAGIVAQHRALMHPANLQANVEALERMLASLKERGASLALVAMPMSPGYVAAASPAERATIVSTLRRLEAKGAFYKDYFRDARFDDSDFRDADHLDVEGATKLTQFVDDEVIRPAMGAAR